MRTPIGSGYSRAHAEAGQIPYSHHYMRCVDGDGLPNDKDHILEWEEVGESIYDRARSVVHIMPHVHICRAVVGDRLCNFATTKCFHQQQIQRILDPNDPIWEIS
jgi:hypothetical protein